MKSQITNLYLFCILFQGIRLLTAENILLLISLLGYLSSITINLISDAMIIGNVTIDTTGNLGCKGSDEKLIRPYRWLILVADIVFLIHLFFHTALLLVLTSKNASVVLSKKSKGVMVPIFSYLAVCNFALWANSSFIESNAPSIFYSANCWGLGSEEAWHAVSSMLTPLVLYYSIHSMFMWLKILDQSSQLNEAHTSPPAKGWFITLIDYLLYR